MNKDYKILFSTEPPKELNDSLGEYLSSQRNDNEEYIFKCDGSEGNLHFQAVEWKQPLRPPFAFVDDNIFKSEVSQMILRRAAGNIGGLNIDDLKDDLVEKSFTVKVLNDYSIGHLSDVILNFALERNVDEGVIRPYVLHLLTFISSLEKANIVSYPIDLDCGFSEDTFFIQSHCRNNGFVFENIMDTLNDKNEASKDIFKDILKNTDLLNIFTIGSTKKLVVTGCWFYESVWSDVKSYSSFIVHDVQTLSADRWELDNSVNSFLKHSLENISKKKNITSLSHNYNTTDNANTAEVLNPLKVKNTFDFLKDKVELPVSKDFNSDDLTDILLEFPRANKMNNLNNKEKDVLTKLLKNSLAYDELDLEVQKVKGAISSEEYVSQLIKNIADMSGEDIKEVFKLNRNEKENVTIVPGTKEDLSEGQTLVKGQSEEAENDVQVVRGFKEEDKQDIQRIKSLNTPDSNEDINKEQSLSQEEIFKKVKAQNEEKLEGKTIVSGDSEDLYNNEVWEIKRLNVLKKMEVELLERENLSSNEVNEKIELIFEEEVGVKAPYCKTGVELLVNNATELCIEDGINNLKDEIKQRLTLERVASQLQTREKQVEKMKELITRLRSENGQLSYRVQDLEKENKVLDFNQRNTVAQSDKALDIPNIEPIEELQRNENVNVSNLRDENEKLLTQIESLKKRVNYMYQNSKTNAGTNLDTNDIQAMASENDRMKILIAKHSGEMEKIKSEKRESLMILEKKKEEVAAKDELLAKYIEENDKFKSKKDDQRIRELTDEMKSLAQENKEVTLKAKSFEQKLKFVNAQLDRFKSKENKRAGGLKAPSGVDAKTKNQIKKLENMQTRMKQAHSKAQKELSEKKTELHKAVLENKTLNVKLRDLEKKLEVLGRKAS